MSGQGHRVGAQTTDLPKRLKSLRRRARLAPRAACEVDAENQNLDRHGLIVRGLHRDGNLQAPFTLIQAECPLS
jgi:hypothetical protein